LVNIFNYRTFNFPIENAKSSPFGQITSTISSTTSIYGSGFGRGCVAKARQIRGKITF